MIKTDISKLNEIRNNSKYAIELKRIHNYYAISHFFYFHDYVIILDDGSAVRIDPKDAKSYLLFKDHRILNDHIKYIDVIGPPDWEIIGSLIGLAIEFNKLDLKDERDITVSYILDNYDTALNACYAEEFIAVLHFEAGVKFEDGYLVHP